MCEFCHGWSFLVYGFERIFVYKDCWDWVRKTFIFLIYCIIMQFLGGADDIEGIMLLSKLFSFVQNIPYRIVHFDDGSYACSENVNIFIKMGDCRHKSLLLYNLLQEKNFPVEKVKVIFDWKDLPIPHEILGLLKKSGTIWSHDALKLNTNPYYPIYIDATWNSELERLGFPVTKAWDGKGSTKNVTNGKVEFFDADGFRNENHGIHIDRIEASEFGEALNAWLDKVSPIK